MLDYDDLRLIASVATLGSPAASAAADRVHISTVYRRLAALERRLGQGLFERVAGGYVPTPLAEELAATARQVAEMVDVAGRRAAGRDDRLTGALTISTVDTLLPLVAAALPEFLKTHPSLTVDLSIGNAMADMVRHEADIAIRATRSPPETLVGRKLAAFDFALYRAPGAADGWIGLGDSLADVPSAVWARTNLAGLPRLRVDSVWAAAEAAVAGLGQAVLPTYLAHGRALERIGGPIVELRSEAWMLYHPDLRRTARVRYFTAAVGPVLAAAISAAA